MLLLANKEDNDDDGKLIAANVLFDESRTDLFSCFLEVIVVERGWIDHHLVRVHLFLLGECMAKSGMGLRSEKNTYQLKNLDKTCVSIFLFSRPENCCLY